MNHKKVTKKEPLIHTEKNPITNSQLQEKLAVHCHFELEWMQLNQALRVLCEIDRLLIHAEDELSMLDNACRIIHRSGYRFVWIGVEENNKRKVLKYFTSAESELEKKYSELIKTDTECKCGPCGTAIHTGIPVVLNDKTSDAALLQWLEKNRLYGFESVASFPLICDGSVLGVITLFSGGKDGFENEDEIEILKELAEDMATGLTMLRMKSKHNLIQNALRKCEEKNRILIQKIQVAIVVHGVDSRIVISNPKAQELLGLTEEELLNKKADDFAGQFFYEDGSLIPPEKNPVLQVFATGEALRNLTARIHHPENENDIWVLINADPVFDHGDELAQIIVTFTDITDRKKAEEMLQKSKKDLNFTLDAAGIGFWEWDINSDLVHATPIYYTMLGYEPKTEPENKKEWLDRVHPQDLDFVSKIFDSVVSHNFKKYQYEARLRQADGTYRWIQSKGFGFEYDKNGMVTRLTGIHTDIHERKLAEQERLATIRFFKSMDLINQAIHKTNDLEQMLSNVLDTMLLIFNADRTLFIYPCDPDSLSWQIPMERAKPEFYGEVFLKKLEMPWNQAVSQQFQKEIAFGGKPVTFGPGADYPLENQLTKKFNFQSHISMAVYPKVDKPWSLSMDQCSYPRVWTQEDKDLFQEIGRRLGDGLTTLLIFRNLQESEAKYHRIVDTAIEGIWMINEDSITTYVNKQLVEMMGYQQEELMDHYAGEFFFEEDIADHKQKIENRKQGKAETFERRIRHKNGQTIWTMVSATPIFDVEKKFKGTFAMFTDITQRKLAEQEHLATINFFKSMDLINQAIHRTNDLEQMMSNVLDTMLLIFDADRAVLVYPCDPQALLWRIPMERAKPEFLGKVFTKKLELPVTEAMSQISQKLIDANGRPVTFGNNADYPLDEEFTKRFQFQSLISMAVYPKVNKPWNMSMDQCSYPRVWTQDDKNLFQEIGRRLSDALTTLLMFRNLHESESKYRRIVDTTNEGIWMINENNITTFVNKRIADILGYQIEELMDHLYTDYIFNEDVKDHYQKMETQKLGTPEVYEQCFRHKNGKIVWTLLSATPVFDEGKNYKGSFGMLTDVTHRKLAEQEHLATIHFFKSMDLINQAIRGTNDLEQMMSDVLDTMLTIFDAEQAVLIYPCDAETPTWRVPMERAKPGFYGNVFFNKLEVPTSKIVADIFQMLIDAGDRPLLFGPEADYLLLKEFTKQFKVQSQISMAVYPKIGKPWELTIDQQSYARVWTREERNLFREIGRRLTDGLTTLLMFRNLQESEAMYRRIIDTTNEGIWMLGEDYLTTFVNARVADMLGYTVEEMLHRSPIDFLFKEDQIDFKGKVTNQGLGVSETYERRYRHKNGNLIWTLISSTSVLDNQKNFKGSFAMLTDITQRKIAEEKLKESEERLRITLDAAQIGIWDLDLVNNLWFATPFSYTALGYEPKNITTGFNEWLEMIHPDDQEEMKKTIEKTIKSRLTDENRHEVRFRHADGTYRWMLVQGFIINRDKDGRVTRIAGVRINIDERKRAEEELRKYHEHLEDLVATRTIELSETNKQLQSAKEAAETANRAKSRFLANMSHELRTPLNAILGYAQIFERDATLSGHQKTGIEIIKSSGEHLLMLISDILDLSRIEANKIELHPSGIDLLLFLDSIKDIMSIRAESKQISIYFQLEPDLPQGIIADETRLRQVLLNLLGNAIKFTDSGYVICRVSVLSCQKENADRQCTINFEVKDTGKGIRNDQLERIFAPFEQVNEIPMREGVGLGLAISRQLVQMMGGDIFVESEYGKGSRFWFDLTFSTTDFLVPSKPADKAISGYKGVRKKILIVDDHQINRLVLTEWFSQLGFDISEAENGFQAITIAQQIQPDIIIMDLLMPGLGGFDVALKIREIPEFSNVVMIAMSASITNVTDEQYAKAGFNDAISKPVDLEKLSNMLRKHMRIEWVYGEPTVKTTEEITEPVISPPPEELKILQKHIQRGDMLQLSKRAQHIETLGKQFIPFAHKLKLLADTFQERRIEAMIEDALKNQNNNN